MSDQAKPSEPGWHVDHTTEQLQRWLDTHIPGTPHDRRVIEEDRYPGEPVRDYGVRSLEGMGF